MFYAFCVISFAQFAFIWPKMLDFHGFSPFRGKSEIHEKSNFRKKFENPNELKVFIQIFRLCSLLSYASFSVRIWQNNCLSWRTMLRPVHYFLHSREVWNVTIFETWKTCFEKIKIEKSIFLGMFLGCRSVFERIISHIWKMVILLP